MKHTRMGPTCLEEEAPSNLHKRPAWAGGGPPREGCPSQILPSQFQIPFLETVLPSLPLQGHRLEHNLPGRSGTQVIQRGK